MLRTKCGNQHAMCLAPIGLLVLCSEQSISCERTSLLEDTTDKLVKAFEIANLVDEFLTPNEHNFVEEFQLDDGAVYLLKSVDIFEDICEVDVRDVSK